MIEISKYIFVHTFYYLEFYKMCNFTWFDIDFGKLEKQESHMW